LLLIEVWEGMIILVIWEEERKEKVGFIP
jgi:hypothetical protein